MCIHKTPDGLCRKYSDDTCTSYCVEGPCPHDTPSTADHIRAMSDEELAELLDSFRSFAVCRRNGNNCFPSFKTEEWLRKPWEEET
jgi:hypothetical protein